MQRAQSALSAIPGAVPSVPFTGEVEALKKAVADVHQLRDAVALLLPDFQRLIYEVERERAVNLRLMQTAAEGPKGFIVTGTARHFTVDQLLEMHERYSAEYDAMVALVTLASGYAERAG